MNQSHTSTESHKGPSMRMEYAVVIAVVFFLFGAYVGNVYVKGSPTQSAPHSDIGGTGMSSQNLSAKDFAEMGNQAYGAGDAPAAIRAYERSLELEPNNPDVLTDLGTMYLHDGQIDEAVSRFRKAMSVAPSHANSRFNLGVALMHKKDWDGATEAFRESIKLAPAGELATRAESHIRTIEKARQEEKVKASP